MSATFGGDGNGNEREELFASQKPGAMGAFNHGFIDFTEIIGFIRRNFLRVTIISAVLTTVFLFLFSLVPFSYQATALVLIDPRERRVTLTENVLSGIGTDSAFLESVVQIVHSDGFLGPVIEDLDIRSDPLFSGSSDSRELLAAFRKQLSVGRVGATFVVEISFSSNDPEKSAFYANAVAEAFVDSQKQSFVAANEAAASSLRGRLEVLREKLERSEGAVARFKASNGIINVAENSTLLQRELISLNDRIAVANAETEAARARFEKLKTAKNLSSIAAQTDAAQLNELRSQRARALQNLSEFNRVYGDKHPIITSERSKLAGIDREIENERKRLQAVQKERLDSSTAALKALEQELASRKKEAASTEKAMVQLAGLQREATANRQLYEEFLARSKATEEQSGFTLEQAKIASHATPPLHSSRPSMALVAVVFAIFSGFIALAYAVIREIVISGPPSNFTKRTKPTPNTPPPGSRAKTTDWHPAHAAPLNAAAQAPFTGAPFTQSAQANHQHPSLHYTTPAQTPEPAVNETNRYYTADQTTGYVPSAHREASPSWQAPSSQRSSAEALSAQPNVQSPATDKLRATIAKLNGQNTGQSRRAPLERKHSFAHSIAPEDVAAELMSGSLNDELDFILRPGSVVVLSSSDVIPEKSDAAIGLTQLAAQQSVPVLLLSSNARLKESARGLQEEWQSEAELKVVDPKDIASQHFGKTQSIWDIVEGFAASQTGHESLIVVDAPAIKSRGQILRLAEFSDYFMLVESANQQENRDFEYFLEELPGSVQEKLRRVYF